MPFNNIHYCDNNLYKELHNLLLENKKAKDKVEKSLDKTIITNNSNSHNSNIAINANTTNSHNNIISNNVVNSNNGHILKLISYISFLYHYFFSIFT